MSKLFALLIILKHSTIILIVQQN